jgi:CTP:molybdopterin cytidylyltransferase MocA
LREEKGIDVVLPAGGRIDGPFAREAGTEAKALLRLNGRTLLARTLDALRGVERVRRIVVVGPEAALEASAGVADFALPEAETGPANVLKGLERLGEANGGRLPDRALILATDLPFLSAGILDGFLNACPPEAAFCVPLIRREAFDATFPETPSAFVRLREGEWTLGCAFLVDPSRLAERRAVMERAFAARKSQLAMARLLGLPFLARFVTRRLTIPLIERRCEEILGCSGRGIADGPPELAYDIDLPEDYHYAVSWAARNESERTAPES